MKQFFVVVLFLFATISVSTVYGQNEEDKAARELTRGQLEKLLDRVGPTMNVAFSRSQKQPFNYIGSLAKGLVNTESFEIVVSVTAKGTIGFRVYPHYKAAYINVDKVNDRAALMRLLLRLSDRAFLFWGADESGDVFTGYTFTLESGFPEEAITVVLQSIPNSDGFIGEMRPILDAPIAPVPETKPAPTTKKTPSPRRGT